MADPLSLVPPGKQYDALRKKLEQLKRDYPDKYAGLGSSENNQRISDWITEIDSGTGRDAERISADIDKHIIGGDPDTEEKTPKEEEKNEEGYGKNPEEGEEDLTILTSDEMKWYFDKSTGKWYVEYGLPGSDRTMFFEAEPEDMDALFGEGRRPRDYKESTFKELAGRADSTFAGDIGEMHGTGSFEAEMERIQAIALDEGRLPDWAKQDPAIMDLLYIAQAEEKSDEWLIEQISKTDSFKKRFPDIKSFQDAGNLTLEQAIGGFLQMEAGVKAALKASGFDPESVTPEVVGGLLKAGHSLDVINRTAASFKRMKDFKPALEAFNAILREQGIDPISSIGEMLEFVEGRASSEVYDIWEASSIQEAAVAAGLGDVFTAEDAMEAALAGNHTLESASQAMAQAARLLLRMRHEVDIGAFNLDQDDLIDLSLGVAPRSGRSSAEIQDSIQRAMGSAEASLKKRTSAFRSFDAEGTPQATSLKRARQES